MTLTRRGRITAAFSILVGMLGVLALGGYVYLRSLGLSGPGDPGAPVGFVIPKGSNADEIGNILERKGVIESAFAFRVAVFLDGGAAGIQAGEYELRRGLTARAALAALVEGGPIFEFVNVTFPEGSWLEDFARILDEDTHISGDAFLALTISGRIRSRYRPRGVDTMEGLLFPSTYQIAEEDEARSVAVRLAREFEDRASKLDFSETDALNITPYEAIIVASMVEAEARAPGDRDKIAAVIYNRIREGMPLGIDATVLYALGEHKEELTASDLEIDSPYNTRIVAGLPPTPIGAPGLASLEAAVHPADGTWLYYVLADCEGHHAFSTSYREFLANKAAYQELDC